MRAVVGIVAGVLVGMSPVPARADTRDAAAAQALFEAGRQAETRGDWATACPKFAESERLDPAPGTLLNLADCEEHLGHLASAWDAWHEAIASLPPGDDRAGPAKKRAAALDARIPRLTVRLAADAPPGASVHRDALELGAASLGVPLPVDPGAHVVRVEAPGHEPASTPVTLAEGESRVLEVSAGAANAPAPPPPAQPAPPAPAPPPPAAEAPAAPPAHPVLRTTGFVLGIAGLASLAAGGVTGGLAFAQKSTVQAHCPAPRGCDQTGLDAAQNGHTYATVSDVTFVAGGVLLAAGAALVLLNPARDAQTTGWLLAPSPSGASIGWRGSF
ncbi:MAG TPA: PEGA domain-containing protein [Polyangiaceae bacterium]|nr:PEGA domain-containing protein [Polyangiaceae bacterium]